MALVFAKTSSMSGEAIAHEGSSAIIGIGTAMIGTCHSCSQTKIYLIFLTFAIAIGVTLKCFLYVSKYFWSPLESRKRKKQHPSWLYLLCHEISTLGIAGIWGVYLGTILKNIYVREDSFYLPISYGIILSVFFFILKFFLYSHAWLVDRAYSFHIPTELKAARKLLGKVWTRFFHLFSTIAIGCILGIYLYESRMIFHFAKWFPNRYPSVYERQTALIGPIFGEYTIREKYRPKSFQEMWSKNRPYMVAGMLAIGILLWIKFYLYTHPQPYRSLLYSQDRSKLRTQEHRIGWGKERLARTQEHRIGWGKKRLARTQEHRIGWGKERLARTQEHRIGWGKERLARTQEHRVRGKERITRTQEHRARGKERLAKTQEHRVKGKDRITRTQEHRVRGKERLARTQEHRVRGKERITRTQEHRVRGMKEKILLMNKYGLAFNCILEEILYFLCAVGIGLLISPFIQNIIWNKRMVYPYGALYLLGFTFLIIYCFINALGKFRFATIPSH